MKVGFHAGEEWESVIERKLAEIASAGVAFWGYGGSACHPTRQVQPFARKFAPDVSVAMLPTSSRPVSPSLRAEEMSEDGSHWERLPPGVIIRGSKWALVLDDLRLCEKTVDLGQYEVGVGRSAGKPAAAYLRGQSDKACLRRAKITRRPDRRQVVVLGHLAEPWAVFLRPS